MKLLRWRFISRGRGRIAIAFVLWIAIGVLLLLTREATIVNGTGRRAPLPTFVDQSPPKTEFELTNRVQVAIPNLPSIFLMQHRHRRRRWNATCANLPSLFRIRINQLYWQHARLIRAHINVYLYAAYYDNRVLLPVTNNTPITTNVRLLAMVDHYWNRTSPTAICQFWHEDSDVPSFSSQATFNFIWRPKWGYEPAIDLLPVLITCPLPRDTTTIPRVVSLVERPCDNAQNALRVQHSLAKDRRPTVTKEFAVCVKGLIYHDQDRSVRLVEWLEFLRSAGADRVFLYELAVHPNMSRVLRHYEQTGFVDVTPLTLAGDQPSNPNLLTLYLRTMVVRKRQNEVIPYNDCLYRNLYRYRHVVLLDIDEAIVPTRPELRTWSDMLRDALAAVPTFADGGSSTAPPLVNEKWSFSSGGGRATTKRVHFSSLCTRTVYFFDNATSSDVTSDNAIPRYMHMLGHVMRARNYVRLNHYTKCFHSTLHVLTLHNHFPIQCLTPKCRHFNIPTTSGQLQHYRNGCAFGQNMCGRYMGDAVADRSLWLYREEMIRGVRSVLHKLGFDTVT